MPSLADQEVRRLIQWGEKQIRPTDEFLDRTGMVPVVFLFCFSPSPFLSAVWMSIHVSYVEKYFLNWESQSVCRI